MAENLWQRGHPFWTSPIFGKVQNVFWFAFVMVPCFTGLLAYHWLPNESFDERKDDLLESHDVSDGEGHYGDKVDLWQDKGTGKVYSVGDFYEHRRQEEQRLVIVRFAYGLIGCFFYASSRFAQRKGSFFEAFGKTTLVNLAIVACMWIARRTE
jgi:hypothetical protein